MTRVLDIGADTGEFAEAIVNIDVQLPHFAEADDLLVLLVHKNTKRKLHARCSLGRAYWHADVGVWARYSCGFAWSGAPPKSKRRSIFRPTGIVQVVAGGPIEVGQVVSVGMNGYVVPHAPPHPPIGIVRSAPNAHGLVEVVMDQARIVVVTEKAPPWPPKDGAS